MIVTTTDYPRFYGPRPCDIFYVVTRPGARPRYLDQDGHIWRGGNHKTEERVQQMHYRVLPDWDGMAALYSWDKPLRAQFEENLHDCLSQ